MKIVDLNDLQDNVFLEADLCIVGSGPSGLSLANEFVGTNTRVLVLESGGLADEPESDALYEIESTGWPREKDQAKIRRRILGGSSHIWTGRCVPFQPIDFERRSWMPGTGWPVSYKSYEPYFERAGKYLGLGPNRYDESLWESFGVEPPQPPLSNPSLGPRFWQFSKRQVNRDSMRFGQDWITADAPNIQILLHANVSHINLNPDGTSFESVDVVTLHGKRARVKAGTVALCCGGIDNARLLLASNRVYATGVGNQYDMVGRYLMDHISIAAGDFDPQNAFEVRSRFGGYWLDDENGRHRYLHGLGLTPEAQERDQLVNCDAYLDEGIPGGGDPWGAFKRLTSRRGFSGRDARVLLTNLGEIGGGLYRRSVKHRPELGPVKKVNLELILEQVPDPESRLTLSANKKDALGMPLSSIHWKVSDTERRTAKRIVELICEEFKRLGLPAPCNVPQFDEKSLFYERYHPTGTTRMSSSPRNGVVDENCQVHGIQGLFVSSSSVFPTAGAANPTLMIVATAVRLADHLKRRQLEPAPVLVSTEAALAR
jgi:choline dehydrogenase-like flavoprotein